MSAPAVPDRNVIADDNKQEHAKEGSIVPARHDSKEEGQQPQQEVQLRRGDRGDIQSQKDAQDAALRNRQAFASNHSLLPTIDTTIAPPSVTALAHRSPRHLSPATAGLHLQTNVAGAVSRTGTSRVPTIYETPVSTEAGLHQSMTSPIPIAGAGSSLGSALSTSSMASSLSPGSTLPSPYLAAMTDLTPLPSPLTSSDSLGAWRRTHPGTSGRSRESSLDEGTPACKHSSLPSSPVSPTKKKKGYGSLVQEATMANAAAVQENAKASNSHGHSRHRSISDFVPEALHNVRQRHVTFGPGDAASLESQDYRMQREAYLAAQRGLTVPLDASKHLPTPPGSTSGVAESDEIDDTEMPYLEDGTAAEYLEIHCGIHNKRRKFRQLRQLGQGTFSKVMLATRERIPAHITPEIEDNLDPQRLVAVKMVEHGPAGGADEKRIETSLKREVEMLKSVNHQSLIHLKACEYQPTRTLLVLTYCHGGDLFELASEKREVLTPPMVQRMFAELVSAVRYLHDHWIVHRDIKLENVLVNMPTQQLIELQDPTAHPTPIVTLTDLGLSRKIPQPPESPLLTTRCGSEDYAAPEILLGQPYDGRQTDAWALGVLLYALMEGRLPFDAPPGKPDRSRNTHRIARCDWIWCRFGDEDGEWDPSRAQGFEGAQHCVEGLLKKVRMGRKPLEEIEKLAWVQQGISVPGGLRMREEDEDDEMN
ncbi:hypothetical protein LTR85_004993 [Meristemomyces frigidus]|nr:hypothetical protein LTR85_004993 [Meristemomyces frigidus]